MKVRVSSYTIFFLTFFSGDRFEIENEWGTRISRAGCSRRRGGNEMLGDGSYRWIERGAVG